MASNPNRVGVPHVIEEPQYSCLQRRYRSVFWDYLAIRNEYTVRVVRELLNEAAAYVVAKYGAEDPWRALPNGDLPEPNRVVEEGWDPLAVGPPYSAQSYLAVAPPHTQEQLESIRVEIKNALYDGAAPGVPSPEWYGAELAVG